MFKCDLVNVIKYFSYVRVLKIILKDLFSRAFLGAGIYLRTFLFLKFNIIFFSKCANPNDLSETLAHILN